MMEMQIIIVYNTKKTTKNNNVGTVTTSGCISQQPARLIEEMGETALTAAEQNYYFALSEYLEYGCVGAGIGSGILSTHELKVIGYDDAMQRKNKKQWLNSINEEHNRMLKNKVWTVIKKKDMPKNADIIDSTWAMKKKANGQYRACLAARGFKQPMENHLSIMTSHHQLYMT